MSCQGFEYWILMIWAILKPISSLLGTIADKTECKWDNKVALFFSYTLSYLAWFIGIFGIGDVPKSVKRRPVLRVKRRF